MSMIIDADDYFRAARSAMLKAERRIMLIGWDFDARISLVDGGREAGEPETIGEFILWLVKRRPELEVFLLRWDVGAMKTLAHGSTLLTVLKWMRHPRIHTKLDGHHPSGASHHQKIVVIDDCFAFCGGIDMTSDRWDTRDHLDNDPRRTRPDGKAYGPWHDATSALDGPVAAALGALARDRWQRAGASPIEAVAGRHDCWPDALEPQFTAVDVTIARTEPEMPDQQESREVEAMFVAQIAAAKSYIYAESQYFASRRIAEAIARRLDEDEPPEIVIINPLAAQGWLEPIAMDTARARLVTALRKRDRHGRLRFYHPFTTEGEPIYVHAKILIVDDTWLRVGSANMNNRSMGLDTECDIAVEARDDPSKQSIRDIRCRLLAEHLGKTDGDVAAEVAARGSLIETIEALRGSGHSLRPYEIADVSEVEAWLADNQILDPESPSEMFEALSQRGLFRRLLRRPKT